MHPRLVCSALLLAAVSCNSSDPKPSAPAAKVDAGEAPAYAGEDAAVQDDPPGSVLAAWPMPDIVAGAANKPSYDVSAKTVTDTVTQLVWQRELPAIYPGCTGKSRTAGAGGSGAGQMGDSCSVEEAKKYCASAGVLAALGGKGWRLPSKIELESLVNHVRVEPALDATAFAGAPSGIFWTSTLDLGENDSAWFVDFDNGTSSAIRNDIAFRVRCVSSPERAGTAAEQYSVASHTVKDLKTGLTWQRYVDPDEYEWAEANMYCAQLGLEGGGWRLPTLKELLTVVDPTRAQPAIDPKVFPLTPVHYFWSATTHPKSKGVAWYVMFSYGSADYNSDIQEYRVRCVR